MIEYFFENYDDEHITHSPAFRVTDELYLGLQYFIGNPSMSRANIVSMIEEIRGGLIKHIYFLDTRVYFEGENVYIHSFHPIDEIIYPIVKLLRRDLTKIMRKMLYVMDMYRFNEYLT